MTLYEMLDNTLFYQEVWIYETNCYDQNMPLFKGTVQEARGDTEKVWDYLMCTVAHYECDTGILLIKVKNEHYQEKLESHYMFSDKWGVEENKRPWKHSSEISKELFNYKKE